MINNKKIIIALISIVLMLALVYGGIYYKKVVDYRADINGLTFSNVDISKIPDGTYTGEYDADLIYAKVNVTLVDGRITNIELVEHSNDRGAKAEKIIEDIVNEQVIDVDDVTGATNSSKVIKKAVDNAINNLVNDIK